MKRTLTSLIASLLITFAAEAVAELFADSPMIPVASVGAGADAPVLVTDGHFFALPLPL